MIFSNTTPISNFLHLGHMEILNRLLLLVNSTKDLPEKFRSYSKSHFFQIVEQFLKITYKFTIFHETPDDTQCTFHRETKSSGFHSCGMVIKDNKIGSRFNRQYYGFCFAFSQSSTQRIDKTFIFCF